MKSKANNAKLANAYLNGTKSEYEEYLESIRTTGDLGLKQFKENNYNKLKNRKEIAN